MGNDQKRAVLAVAISAVILFLWQYFIVPTYQPKATENSPAVVAAINNATQAAAQPTTDTTKNEATIPVSAVTLAKVKLSNGNEYEISDTLALKNIHQAKENNFKEFTGSENPLEIYEVQNQNQVLNQYNLSYSENGNTIRGTSKTDNSQVLIEISDNGFIKYTINSPTAKKYRVVFNSSKKALENKQERKFIILHKKLYTEIVGKSDTGENSVKWVGLDFNYHLLSLVVPHEEPVLYKIHADGDNGTMAIDFVNPKTQFEFKIIYTKKNYDELVTLGDNLQLSVDFGILGVISVPILRTLQFFHKHFPNYGLAIILLTIFVRLITFPLQYKSFKSMKKMQVLQPELTKLREKFKADPQKLQKETMDLFKRAGANPLGGCLPMLLQMPIFFAFYTVLSNAIELVGAPFYFWIHDLSNKDPYYVLPVLMTLSMFLQQKMTPTPTTDPMQQKVMMFMPLIFGFIMKDMPSGLSLYIFISTIFGILQQWIVYKTIE